MTQVECPEQTRVCATSILKVPHCLKFVLEFESYCGLQCMAIESLHQAHKLIARLLLETFSIGTQRIGISVSPNNLQFPQHIHWRYSVDPETSHNMRKKY
jgi:hypothetical protein